MGWDVAIFGKTVVYIWRGRTENIVISRLASICVFASIQLTTDSRYEQQKEEGDDIL